MIAVVADDLTGAVEIAGAGLRYGLTVKVVTTLNDASRVDLLVVATDTRSMPEPEAVQTMADITTKLKALNPQFIFKKTDSVLRGHVVAELNTHLKQLGLNKALLVPANPALGRTISNGNYYVNGQPIHQTSFADDPEFAVTSCAITDMVRGNVVVKTPNEPLPATGITVGECTSETDLKLWAAKADGQTLLAGGSGFFTAILAQLGHAPQTIEQTYLFEKPALFISGTTFGKSRELVRQLQHAGGPVSYMPRDIIALPTPAPNLYDEWADEVVSLLKQHNKAVVAIDEITTPGNLRQKQAILVQKVFEKVAVKELLIEGGATASAIIKQLNFNRFTPVQEFSTGVIRMSVAQHDGLFLTLKPGSYTWPSPIWDF